MYVKIRAFADVSWSCVNFTAPATPPNLYLSVSDKRLPLEHVKLPADVMINASDIYISVLTMPRNHPTRFATHLFTWMQTVNPDQVGVILSLCIVFIVNGLIGMHEKRSTS